MKETTKPKAIDLGALQNAFNAAKRQLNADAKALAKAQESFDRSKKAHQEAHEALKAAAHTVLS
jgi:hypothetical protein